MVRLTLSHSLLLLALASFATAAPSVQERTTYGSSSDFVAQTTCNGKTYTYRELAGYGFVPSNFRDKYGDTVSLGSSIALERSSWKKETRAVWGGGNKTTETYYEGTLWTMPDRGWNTEGTTLWQPRLHKFQVDFTPTPANANPPSPPNVKFLYMDTILLRDPSGKPISGLDPTTVLNYHGFPALPAAKYTGDGFGGAGHGGVRMCLDPEGLVLDTQDHDGGFWISDEYGPYVYKFDKTGKMDMAVRPPEAYIPKRKGVQSFASNNPPIYNQDLHPDPANPDSGRSNNQGFEGLTVSGDGKSLYVMLQSAMIQDGGLDKTTNRYTRMLKYDISQKGQAKLSREYVVPLPQYIDPTKKAGSKPRTAAQSEIQALGDGQFFVLSRDGFGRGTDLTTSQYRQIDVFDISSASDIKPRNLQTITTSPTSGTLLSNITSAEYCSFMSFNVDSELSKFGLRNGGADDEHCLNEKWESIAMMPVDGKDGDDDEWWVLSLSDNDFITQDGYIATGGTRYAEGSGLNLENQALLFRVTLPKHSNPFPGRN
ncbi:esterase-like activity of phytase-domain-containing protein [Tirmania nivea]|nr:esterase-like activity of phytase-domain-containing protein [Tirmania nivea]